MNPILMARTVKIGAKNLLMHKARSSLTMLGIIFGVTSVIAMLAIGEGLSKHQQDSILKMGSTNIILDSKEVVDESKVDTSNSRTNKYGLTRLDLRRIAGSVQGGEYIVPIRQINQSLQFATRRQPVILTGTIKEYSEVQNIKILKGRFLTEADALHGTSICIISNTLSKRLFAYHEPLGNYVRAGEMLFEVVGIYESSEKAVGAESVETEKVFVPLQNLKQRQGDLVISRSSGSFKRTEIQLDRIIVKNLKPEYVEGNSRIIQSILQFGHPVMDYEITVPLELLKQAEETKRVFTLVLGSIAAISLLVGGIGIMNIMLATVTERTREIGIRRALGAKKIDVILQFLVETVILSLGGGVIGVLGGVIVPELISAFTNLETIITPWSLFLAFGVSAFIGVVFGIYPAMRAASLDPIEALRHE
ncbi:MAG: ABC transporter permease [Lentisphaeria bacterium]|nr:ABC transporter permease [Lentisphaeria bacterium]